MLTIRDGLKYEQARLIKDIAMLQKLKVTSYAFIYFLMFGFSFIALQVTIVEVEAWPPERLITSDAPGETVGSNVANFKCGSSKRECTFDECLDLLGSDYDLGKEIRYLQITGPYPKNHCYFYRGGTSSGRAGPRTWRFDPDKRAIANCKTAAAMRGHPELVCAEESFGKYNGETFSKRSQSVGKPIK